MERPVICKTVEDAICAKDGGLFCLGWYLAFTPGDENATLDGTFNAEELRSIADYMDWKNGTAGE